MTIAIAAAPAVNTPTGGTLAAALTGKPLKILALFGAGALLVLAAAPEGAGAAGCAGTPLTVAEAALPALAGAA